MKKIILLLAILFCCAFDITAQQQINSEEYEVYKVVLGQGKSLVYRFTIEGDKLNYSGKSSHLKRELSDVAPETRQSYNAQNQKVIELKNRFGNQSTVILVAGQDLNAIFDKLGKDGNELTRENALIEKYGSGTLIGLSRVGFNKNKTQALVAISSNTGLCGTCSTNYYIILSKENGSWIIRKRVMSSIS